MRSIVFSALLGPVRREDKRPPAPAEELTMPFLSMSSPRSPTPWRLALAVAALLLTAPVTWAQPGGYRNPPPQYKERPPQAPPPAVVKRPPVRYTITITFLPPKATTTKVARAKAAPARIVAHLPEGAPVWFADEPTRQRGMVRHFVSSPLKPGKNYTYTFRAELAPGDETIIRMKRVALRAGEKATVDLRKRRKGGQRSAISGSRRRRRYLAPPSWRPSQPHFYSPADYPAPGGPLGNGVGKG
jgi:uncharacterized protein (TIGR03000 family)